MPPSEWTLKTEDCRALSIKLVRKEGFLTSPREEVLTWTFSDGSRTSIRLVSAPLHQITLRYTITDESGTSWPVSDRIRIDWTPCHLGGQRPWFSCPLCGRRVGVLFLRAGYFRCRCCQKLRYRCKSETPLDRSRRRIHKIECRLGGDTFNRPKGMHRTRFERLQRQLEDAEERESDARFNALVRHFKLDSPSGPSAWLDSQLFDQESIRVLSFCRDVLKRVRSQQE